MHACRVLRARVVTLGHDWIAEGRSLALDRDRGRASSTARSSRDGREAGSTAVQGVEGAAREACLDRAGPRGRSYGLLLRAALAQEVHERLAPAKAGVFGVGIERLDPVVIA